MERDYFQVSGSGGAAEAESAGPIREIAPIQGADSLPGSRRSGRLGAMPLMRLIAENIGPFERLDVDFSDGSGNPYRGPHIFAGVNGSGKSTVLRAIAWLLSSGESGFPLEEWRHFLRGPESRALVQVSCERDKCYINAGTRDTTAGWEGPLERW